LLQRLGESYSGIPTGTTRFELTVARVRVAQIYVVGEVQSPGEFDLFRPMTLMQAIAKAGGFTEFAQKDEIDL